jgi:DNA-binding LytR/AlgR family response regulator
MHRARLLIVEDEPLIAADMKDMLLAQGHVVVGVAHSAAAALELAALERPDLVLLDIRLNKGPDGIDVAEALKARFAMPFLFITSHVDPFTLERVQATRPEGFIIKPFEEADLRAQITIAIGRSRGRMESHLVLRDKGRLVKVSANEIRYLEADDNYVLVHTLSQRYVVTGTLAAVEERLASEHFMRIHRSYVVDLRRITGLSEREVLLGPTRLPVGRTYKDPLKQRWMDR